MHMCGTVKVQRLVIANINDPLLGGTQMQKKLSSRQCKLVIGIVLNVVGLLAMYDLFFHVH